jgi:diadenosine tetraphosphate (Ap4A) HIT family hydrolase
MINNQHFDWELDTCLMCDIIAGESWVPFRSFFSKEEAPSELLYETKNFGVIADIGPIVEGHCLVIAKEHIPSFACISQEAFSELAQVKERITKILSSVYTHPIAFEHGAATFTKNAGCCIDHAHLHVIPTEQDILSTINKDFSFSQLESYLDTQVYARKQGYLFYENHQGQQYLAEVNNAPTQYFRRVLATLLKNPESWNWRDQIRYAEVFNTKDKLARMREKLSRALKEI